MRSLPLLVVRLRALLRPRRLLALVIEIALLAWAVLLLEAIGVRATDDGADLIGFLAGGLLVAGLAATARAGYLPATRSIASKVRQAGLGAFRRLDPPSGVAFRLPEEPAPRPDRSRVLPCLVLVLLGLAAVVGGTHILGGLVWIKESLAYTPYLLGLGLLWVLFGAVTTIAFALSRALRGGGAPRDAKRTARGLALFLLWLVGVASLTRIPGIVAVGLYVVVAIAFALDIARRHPGRYFLYRRGESGGVVYVTVHAYLVGYYALIACALFLVTALAQAQRLWVPLAPGGAHTLTLLLGLSATVSALVLLVRGGLYVRRLIGDRSLAPERPLVPTLWWPAGDVDALSWTAESRRRGWRFTTTRQPPDAFDLVVGRDADSRRFVPAVDAGVEDACFRLDRRFHVVKRREFRRDFETLYKEATRQPRPAGAGYLFCPHAWPVPGIVRDTAGAEVEPGSRSSIGGMLVGRPFALAFSPRLRRYLGGILRALDIDVLYWEDSVTFADLRRVFVVLFETYDQGRHPALDRHFIGLPRVSVLIQEADEGEESFLEPVEGELEDMPPPLRARALVVRRDGGGREVGAPDRQPSSHRPEPVLV